MDPDRILNLIDNVLPFEACLYYQVIPLKVTAERIQLGMVEPDDPTVTDYLRRLFQHVDRAIVPNAISADAHQLVMSQYLSRLSQQQQEKPSNAPPTLDWLKSVERRAEPLFLQAHDSSEHHRVPDERDEIAIDEMSDEISTDRQSDASSDMDDLQLDEIHAEPPHLPVSMLVMLPPDRLLPALLSQVLSSGIGRLFFERREKVGSILYSQDGVQQSVLEALPLDLFEATLDRLKQFMSLDTAAPTASKDNPQECDGEFLYRDERVMLRLQMMPGNYGEETTLQVLRGKAMDFYQEQKLAEWSLTALSSAKLLKNCVRKIRSVYQHQDLASAYDLHFLPQLERLLDRLEVEMEDLSHPDAEGEVEDEAMALPTDPSPALPVDTISAS